MALSFGAAVGANGGSTSTTTLASTIPTVTAGHLCVLCVCFGAAGTFSAIAGWTLVAQASNPGGSTHAAAMFARILQAGDTAPTVTFSVAAKRSHVASTWVPGAGETPEVYAQAATVITASGTSHTPNAVTSGDPAAVSYVFNATRAQTNSATAVTQTVPGSYIEPTNGDQSTAVGTTAALRQVGAHVGYWTAAGTGSIAPGAFTLSNGAAVIDIAFHVLIRSALPAANPQILLRSPRPVEQGSAAGPYAPQSSSTLLPGG